MASVPRGDDVFLDFADATFRVVCPVHVWWDVLDLNTFASEEFFNCATGLIVHALELGVVTFVAKEVYGVLLGFYLLRVCT